MFDRRRTSHLSLANVHPVHARTEGVAVAADADVAGIVSKEVGFHVAHHVSALYGMRPQRNPMREFCMLKRNSLRLP